MVVILLITVFVVIFKVVFIDEDPDPNISTFRPLDQMVGSNIRYNGNEIFDYLSSLIQSIHLFFQHSTHAKKIIYLFFKPKV